MNNLTNAIQRLNVAELIIVAFFFVAILLMIVTVVSIGYRVIKNWSIARTSRKAEKRKLKNLTIKDDGIENLEDAAKSFTLLVVVCIISVAVARILC